MRNCLRLMSVLLFVFIVLVPVQARNTLTVFDGADEPNWVAPVNLLYLDEVGTRSQVIYPAEALSEMKNEPINSITFYTYSGIEASGGQVAVSVGETTQTAFGTYVEGLTRVATISITPGLTQLTIEFDTPYLYQGGNLVVESIVEEAGQCSVNADLFYCERYTSYCVISRNEVSKSVPKATFGYGTDTPYAVKILPEELVFNTVRAGCEDVQSFLLKNVGVNPFAVSFSAPEPFVVDIPSFTLAPNETREIPVRFLPTEAGDYAAQLSIVCGGAGIHTVALNASAEAAAEYLTVCDSLAIGTLPIDGVYIDIVGTEGQMIYPAEMLTDMLNSKIVEMKFYPKRMKMNGGVVTLSLMMTDQLEYTETTLLTGLTTVATATPVRGSSEFIFVFDEPFEYTGGNLVVDALVTEPGEENLESSTFVGVATEYWASLEAWNYYGYFVGFLGFLPKATFSYQKVESEYELGDVNHDHTIDVSDVTTLIGYVLTGSAENFFLTEANVDGDADGKIDVGDVTALIGLVLTQN